MILRGMQVSDLGHLVPAVIDERFVDAAEAGAGIGGDVFEAQALDDVDHEIRAGRSVV